MGEHYTKAWLGEARGIGISATKQLFFFFKYFYFLYFFSVYSGLQIHKLFQRFCTCACKRLCGDSFLLCLLGCILDDHISPISLFGSVSVSQTVFESPKDMAVSFSLSYDLGF